MCCEHSSFKTELKIQKKKKNWKEFFLLTLLHCDQILNLEKPGSHASEMSSRTLHTGLPRPFSSPAAPHELALTCRLFCK